MHVTDAPQAITGGPFRPMTAAPGLLHKIMFRLVWDPNEQMQPCAIDQHVADGDVLPVAGGLWAIHVPGHDAGRLAYLWGGEELLIVGDVFMNIIGLAARSASRTRRKGAARGAGSPGSPSTRPCSAMAARSWRTPTRRSDARWVRAPARSLLPAQDSCRHVSRSRSRRPHYPS